MLTAKNVRKSGYTPLDEAIGEAEVVTLLEQAGATHGEGFRIGAAPTDNSILSVGGLMVDNGEGILSYGYGLLNTADLLPEHGISLEAWYGRYDQSTEANLDGKSYDHESSGTWARIAVKKGF